MADAATLIFSDASRYANRCVLDVEVLDEAGITDLSGYGGQAPLEYDSFVDRR